MRTTLRSVLASDALRGGDPQVLAGADRLDASVRWVHVGEVRDVAGLLRGGELILSTGLAMTGPETDAVAYLADLVAAGAAGLVVELGTTLPEVPGPVVAAARTAGFPVIALRRRVRFVEVTEEVHRAIVAEQLAEVELAREVHERFTRLSLDEADATAICVGAAELCGSSVVLEDLSRRVVAFAARGRPAAGLLGDWERRSRRTPWTDDTGISGPEGWVVSPVGGRAGRWGRLVVTDPQTSQTRLAMVLERAAQALELGRMVERDRLGLALQAQGGLLADLAAGRVPDEDSALARAAALGLTTSAVYLPIALRTTPSAGSGRSAAGDPLADHDRVRVVVETLSRSLRGSAPERTNAVLVGPLSATEAGVVLGLPDATTATADRHLLRLAAAAEAGTVTIGAGEPASSLREAGLGLRQARHVAEVASSLARGGARASAPARAYHRSSDLRIHGLVALLQDDPRLQRYTEAELAPLLEHEARTSAGLLDLLRLWVAVGGNKTRLAERSHRSRPAVYKKLATLERVLGVDLDDPLSLVSLSVAVLAHDARAADR